VKRSTSSALSNKYNNASIKLKPNELDVTAIQIKFSTQGCSIIVDSPKGKHTIQSGWEKWVTGKESATYPFTITNRNLVKSKMAATATWASENSLQINVKFVEAIHGDKITFDFEGSKVVVSFLNSVSESNTASVEKRARLEGTIV
jgi:hypothetical protein